MSETPSPTSSEPREPRVRYDVVLPHATEPRVLLLREARGWVLPRFDETKPRWPGEAAPVAAAVREALGADVTVLRYLHDREDPDTKDRERFYFLENHDPAWALPANGGWFGREEVAVLPLAVPEQRAVLEEWFADTVDGRIPALRTAWARPGWFAPVRAWITNQLRHGEGRTIQGPLEQVKLWSISCILRVPTTDGGEFYFKAVPPLFDQEPRITEGLARAFPGSVPELVALDGERGWMLMRAFSGTRLWEQKEIGPWEGAVRRFAEMQIAQIDRRAEVLGWGCPDRGMAETVRRIDDLLADTPAMQPKPGEGLSDEEIARLRSLAPRLRALCDEMAALGVPETLVHGDLHPGNIVVTAERGVLFYDWTDGALAHPFMDPYLLIPKKIEGAPDAADRLRRAYLEPWTALVPMERLEAAYALAGVFLSLYHAQSYHYIARSTEPAYRHELGSGVWEYLRDLLKKMDEREEGVGADG